MSSQSSLSQTQAVRSLLRWPTERLSVWAVRLRAQGAAALLCGAALAAPAQAQSTSQTLDLQLQKQQELLAKQAELIERQSRMIEQLENRLDRVEGELVRARAGAGDEGFKAVEGPTKTPVPAPPRSSSKATGPVVDTAKETTKEPTRESRVAETTEPPVDTSGPKEGGAVSEPDAVGVAEPSGQERSIIRTATDAGLAVLTAILPQGMREWVGLGDEPAETQVADASGSGGEAAGEVPQGISPVAPKRAQPPVPREPRALTDLPVAPVPPQSVLTPLPPRAIGPSTAPVPSSQPQRTEVASPNAPRRQQEIQIAEGPTTQTSTVQEATTPPSATKTSSAAASAPVTDDQDRPDSEKPVDVLLLDQGGVLLRRGQWVIEPGVEYSHSGSDRVNISGFSIFDAIVIGTIRVDDIDREVMTAYLGSKTGLGRRVQVETRVPFLGRWDRETLSVGTPDQAERNTRGSGIGDAEMSVAWQPFVTKGGPDFVLRLRQRFPTGKSPFEIETVVVDQQTGEERLSETPTGGGFWGTGLSGTFILRSDPLVFFTGGGYTRNFSNSFAGFGKIDPGDTLDTFAGFNLAVNDAVSVNFSVSNQWTQETRVNGVTSPGSSFSDGRFGMGAAVSLSPGRTLLLNSSIGLTDNSPDFTMSASLPFSL